jgi:hypothetical protein
MAQNNKKRGALRNNDDPSWKGVMDLGKKVTRNGCIIQPLLWWEETGKDHTYLQDCRENSMKILWR